MSDVEFETTKKIAELAKLSLTDAEIRLYSEQLGKVLDYVKGLQKVDVSGVKPYVASSQLAPGANSPTLLREDLATQSEEKLRQGLLDSAPQTNDDQFKVKAVL